MSPDENKHVTKSGGVLAIPGRLSDRDLPIGMQRPPKERHETVEAEEQGRRALDSQVRPLALCLNTQMGTPLLKRHFQTPAFHKEAIQIVKPLSPPILLTKVCAVLVTQPVESPALHTPSLDHRFPRTSRADRRH